jgi:hypothetical protein
MSTSVVDDWLAGPIREFVDEAGSDLALLLHPSGQVMAQHGFTRAVDVMSACALAAGIYATGAELGRLLDDRPFRSLHHAGATRQIFIAEARWARGAYIFLTVFGPDTSLGIVRLYFDELVSALGRAAPAEDAEQAPALAEHFEQDLNRNLASLFGRDT